MGLRNGVAIFQRVVEWCLDPVKDVASAYVDDIIIGTGARETEGETIQAHEEDVRRVLEALRTNKLVADKRKCKWFVKEVEFCGHILGKGTRRPAPGKLMALEKWEDPRRVTAVRGFLGLTNYYSAYISGYAEMVAGLMDLLKVGKAEGKKGSKKPIHFTPKHREAFQAIKEKLTSALLLHTVDPDKPFVMRVDASDRAVGAALEQFHDKEPHTKDALSRPRYPVAFCSRKLTAGQVKTWTATERETYAIVLALQKGA